MDLLRRMISGWGAMWGRLEAFFGGIGASWRARRRRLRAEARLIGAEVRQIGVQLWERIDELGVRAESFKLTPIRTQFYGHGAFMGAAPALLADSRWRRILAFLMPDVFEQLRAAIEAGGGPHQLMGMLENNPVLAAFGVFRAATREAAADADEESPHHLAGIEWDLFVDSALLERWESAPDAETRAKLVVRALDTSLIAHASAADTVQEAMGICQYQDVRKTPKTELGGVELDSWIDLFGRALVLARADDLDAAVAIMSADARVEDGDECARHTFVVPWKIARVVEVHREATGKTSLSVIIEIKSLRSTAGFVEDIVRALNKRGVHVAAVASFIREEVRGVGAHAQRIHGVEHPGPREIQFFHFAGDLQAACDVGAVEAGQSVLFNAASLLDVVSAADARPVYSTKLGVVGELEEYRAKHDLHIGLYVQEGDCDHAAAALISDLVDARPETFELGFAWGGLRDEAHLPASDEARLGYGSQRMLEYVGRARQWETRAALPR